MIFSGGCFVQAPTPASASDALMSFRNCAAALRIVPLRRLFRKLAMQVFAKLRRVGQFAEAAPIEAAVGSGDARSNSREVHKSAISYQRQL